MYESLLHYLRIDLNEKPVSKMSCQYGHKQLIIMILHSIKASDITACASLFAQVFSSELWNEEWAEAFAFERLSHFYQSKGFIGVLAEQ